MDGAEPLVAGSYARRLIGGGGAGWAIADQAFSSLTNFALGLVVERETDAAGFGAFSLGFAGRGDCAGPGPLRRAAAARRPGLPG